LSQRINRGSAVPLYEQIAQAIRWMIATGEITPGRELEPTRDGAVTWGVNRHTVSRAYRRLVEWGLVEARPPSRFLVRGAGGPSGADSGARAFVDEFVRMADERFGLDRDTLADLVTGRTPERGALPTVVVVECNSTQVNDHAAEIELRWKVRAVGHVLGSGPLPRGPVVCTFFHFDDLRRLAPDRLADTRFVAVRPAADLMGDAIARVGDAGPITVVADEDEAEAQNLSTDLHTLFPPERHEHQLRVRKEWQRDGAPVRWPTLVGPRAYEGLTTEERAQDDVFNIRYRIEATDLASLGEHFGWSKRPPVAN
jgi:DNA-binding transcriptional regulator YhcF (GntR family)